MKPYKLEFNGVSAVLELATFGSVRAVWTEAGHAHIRSGSRLDDGTVVFRGARYYVTTHVYAARGWKESDHVPPVAPAEGQDVTRVLAPSYRARLMAEISEAVTAFTERYPEVLRLAERLSAAGEVEAAAAAERETRGAHDAALARLQEAQCVLDRLDARAGKAAGE